MNSQISKYVGILSVKNLKIGHKTLHYVQVSFHLLRFPSPSCPHPLVRWWWRPSSQWPTPRRSSASGRPPCLQNSVKEQEVESLSLKTPELVPTSLPNGSSIHSDVLAGCHSFSWLGSDVLSCWVTGLAQLNEPTGVLASRMPINAHTLPIVYPDGYTQLERSGWNCLKHLQGRAGSQAQWQVDILGCTSHRTPHTTLKYKI